MPKLVIIESPYAGEIQRNTIYARRAVRDSLLRSEYPFASHLFYTQTGILKDEVKIERALGISAGHGWMTVADLVAVYEDYGQSSGMKAGIEMAQALDLPIEYRQIGRNP